MHLSTIEEITDEMKDEYLAASADRISQIIERINGEDSRKTNDRPWSWPDRVLFLFSCDLITLKWLEVCARCPFMNHRGREIVRRSSKLVHGSLSKFSGAAITLHSSFRRRNSWCHRAGFIIHGSVRCSAFCSAEIARKQRNTMSEPWRPLHEQHAILVLAGDFVCRIARVITVISSNPCS